MKASEQYFPVVLFIMLYKVVLTFESVESKVWSFKWAALSCGAIYDAVQGQGGSNSANEILTVNVTIQIKARFERFDIFKFDLRQGQMLYILN